MKLCDYGCGQEGIYQFKNGKWCCCEKWQSCENHKKFLRENMAGNSNPMYGRKHTFEAKKKQGECRKGKSSWNLGRSRSEKVKKILREKLKGREPWNKGKTNVYTEKTILKMKSKITHNETKKKLVEV